eukprot:2994640-Pleurochrysis_carterae.AAC.1
MTLLLVRVQARAFALNALLSLNLARHIAFCPSSGNGKSCARDDFSSRKQKTLLSLAAYLREVVFVPHRQG